MSLDHQAADSTLSSLIEQDGGHTGERRVSSPVAATAEPSGFEGAERHRPGSLIYIDTVPRHDLPIYSDGNFGEVAPDRLSPMSWSLIGTPMEAASRLLGAAIAPGQTWFSGSRFAFVGQFALKPYHNLTAFCSLAAQMPGVEPEDVTRSFFEDQEPPDLFPGARASAATRARIADRFASYWLRVLAERPTLTGDLAVLEATVDSHVEAGRASLLVPDFMRIIERGWACHIAATCATVPLSVIVGNLGRRLYDHWDEIEADLIAPKELVWHSLYGPGGSSDPFLDGFLTAPFYEIADDLDPWSDFAKARPLLSAVDNERQYSVTAQNLDRVVPRGRWRALYTASSALSRASEEREASKALVMRTLHVGRRLVRSLAAQRGIEDWPYLTFDELSGRSPQSVLLTTADLTERIAVRREQAVEALALTPPARLDIRHEYEEHRAPKSVAVEAAVGRVLAPSPGSPRISGVARRWPLTAELPEDEDVILVCKSADADIQPILSAVRAVVSERGSLMSHIAILCRGWGVPCLAHPSAAQFVDGDRLTVDVQKGRLSFDRRQDLEVPPK